MPLSTGTSRLFCAMPIMGPPKITSCASGSSPPQCSRTAAHRRAERHQQVARPRHRRPGDGDDPLDERDAAIEEVGEGRRRADVVDEDLDVERQAAGGYLLAEDGLDEHLLGALGILHLERHDLDVGRRDGAQGGDGVGLLISTPT